jgi:hypothetical protein
MLLPPPAEPGTSVVEGLDEEPEARRGLALLGEFLLGAVLVLAVLSWAGWQWWDQSVKTEAYKLGDQAAAASDWDAALARFAAASPVKDSALRASDAATKIAERDRQYRIATEMAGKEQWAEALNAVRKVRAIQPSYSNGLAALGGESEEHVYRDALSGTVALRVDATPRGLYYRTGDRWAWLQGSDKASTVQGFGPRGHIMYDVPAFGSPSGQERHLMAAVVEEGNHHFFPMAFDPAGNSYFVLGEAGAWALSLKEGGTPLEQRDLRSPFVAFNLDYQGFGSPVVRTIELPGPEWAVMDLAPDGERMLVADLGPPGADPQSVLVYLQDAKGGERRLIYRSEGGLRSAQFSPDSKYALLMAYAPQGSPLMVNQRSVLVDLATPGSARTLGERMFENPVQWSYLDHPMTGTFLTESVFAGKLLLVTRTLGSMKFEVFDPAAAASAPISFTLDDNPVGGLSVSEDAKAIWVLPSGPLSARGKVIRIDERGLSTMLDTGPADSRAWSGLWVREDRLVYGRGIMGSNDRQSYTLYTAPLRIAGGPQSSSSMLYEEGPPRSPESGRSWSPGPGMLAYLEDGHLHARAYDGSVDLILEGGVLALYDWSAYDDFRHWLR